VLVNSAAVWLCGQVLFVTIPGQIAQRGAVGAVGGEGGERGRERA
jgi:hypothetical protein